MAAGRRSNSHYDPEPLQSLTNRDFSDTALLHVFDDCLDNDGTTTSAAIATALELETEQPVKNVGIRLSWLQRYGIVIQNEERRWQWTTQGENAFKEGLTRQQERALDAVTDHALLRVMHGVGERLGRLNQAERALLRREWDHSYGKARR